MLYSCFQVILPGGVSYAEVCGASAVSKVCVMEGSSASCQSESWLLLWEDGISIYPAVRGLQPILKMELTAVRRHGKPSHVIHENRERYFLVFFCLFFLFDLAQTKSLSHCCPGHLFTH